MAFNFKNMWGGNAWGEGNMPYDRWFDGSEAAVGIYDNYSETNDNQIFKSNGSLSIEGKTTAEVAEIKKMFKGIEKQIVNKMDNQSENWSKFHFTSTDHLKKDVAVRVSSINLIKYIHENFSNISTKVISYPSNSENLSMPTDKWELVNNDPVKGIFRPQSGVNSTDAIERMFQLGADCKLDCERAITSIIYKSMSENIAKEAFNEITLEKLYIGEIDKSNYPPNNAKPPVTNFIKAEPREQIDHVIGDIVYFENGGYEAYLNELGVEGFFRGEFTICVGGNRYIGLGIGGTTGISSEAMRKELFMETMTLYNRCIAENKNVPMPKLENVTIALVVRAINSSVLLSTI